ncbi:hypothetical protein [Methanoregula sp.]|nr:hypothetical protein [Methanoregula sp.]MDD5142685.1 hypothetical protein [Methanoregula sp.]
MTRHAILSPAMRLDNRSFSGTIAERYPGQPVMHRSTARAVKAHP